MGTGIHLIMPMGGNGSRFYNEGFNTPKPLIMIHDKPFFYWATQSIAKYTNLRSLTFVVLKEHILKFNIDDEIKRYYPHATIRVLEDVLNGAVLTSLKGVKAIEDQEPIVFNDCDHIFKCTSFSNFCNEGQFDAVDGALLTFESEDPKFSFVDLNEAGNVVRTVEKQAISNQAICGAYYFRNREIFETAAKSYLDVCQYKEFFMSGVYNVMAEHGGKIVSFKVDRHVTFGTPEEYKVAQGSNIFEVQ